MYDLGQSAAAAAGSVAKLMEKTRFDTGRWINEKLRYD